MNHIICIKNESENVLVIEKSKFLAFSFVVDNENQVENNLEYLRQKYKDSTHICYAYVIKGKQKCSDDNEPQGTAGKPMLDCLLKKGLVNVLVVVVRYFGGIKLGAGGLVRAYSNSASLVLEKSGQKVLDECIDFVFEISNNEIGKIQIIKKFEECLNLTASFKEKIAISVLIKRDNLDAFIISIENLLNRKIEILTKKDIFY